MSDAGNSTSMNVAVASRFPDPIEATTRLVKCCLGEGAISTEAFSIFKSFQRDTILALADCLVTEAARLERQNKYLDWMELKNQAQVLRDYAETLVPASLEAEATR